MTVELPDPPTLPACEIAPPQTLTFTTHALRPSVSDMLSADWQTLFDRDARGSAWQHPQSVVTECQHLSASPLEPLLIGCGNGGELLGAAILLPKTILTSQAGALGPGWKLNGYRLVGGRFLNSEQVPSVDRQLLSATLDAVGSRRADFLLIEDLDQQSPLADQVLSDLPAGWNVFVPNGRQARLRIRFPAQGDEYWNQFSKKTLGTFRRKLKKFGDARLERITSADQVPEFLAQAHEISRQTWQSRRLGLRIRNNDAERASLSALAEAGLLRSYLWFSNGEPAAFCVGNQAHGVFNYEEVGYATKFAKFSPGQMLIVQMIEDLLAHERPEWFDFGGGDADYKRMFANHTSESGTVWVTPPAWKARASLGWIQCGRALKQTARRAIATLGLATRVRQWIRYGGAPTPTTNPEEETP